MAAVRSMGGRPITLNPEVVFRRIGEEAVLVPVRGESAVEGELFALNEVGAFIWERLAEGVLPDAIAQRIAEVFDVDVLQANEDLDRFLHELVAAGCTKDGL
jgi:hypothetical protein